MTNSLGNIAAQISYDGFGSSAGSSLTRYDYTGRERDPDTGLMYYRARWDDSQAGRFITEDPAAFNAGINFYEYVGNNPNQWTDPYGLCKCGIKKGPEYNVSGTVPGGTVFRWHAEFLNDATHDPKCCEVRQLISWNHPPFGPNTIPHAGFPPRAQAGQWLEDRDEHNKRYGGRTGPYTDPDPRGRWYHLPFGKKASAHEFLLRNRSGCKGISDLRHQQASEESVGTKDA